MDIKGSVLFIVALIFISGAIGATVCKGRGIDSARGMIKIVLLTFLALFAAVAALLYILATYFPH